MAQTKAETLVVIPPQYLKDVAATAKGAPMGRLGGAGKGCPHSCVKG